jgi:hypothetical protein
MMMRIIIMIMIILIAEGGWKWTVKRGILQTPPEMRDARCLQIMMFGVMKL